MENRKQEVEVVPPEEEPEELTDDDLTAINGRRDQLEGKIQERYGLAKDQAKEQIDDWYGSQSW